MTDTQPIVIRDATLEDIPRMFRISVKAHRDSYQELIPSDHFEQFLERYSVTEANEVRYKDVLASRIQSPVWSVWVAVDPATGIVAGYTLAKRLSDDFLQIRGMFVDPAYQGRGIGKLLFEHLLSAIPSGTIRLSVIDSNSRAIHIYEKAGFVPVGKEQKPYYGATRIIMEYHKH